MSRIDHRARVRGSPSPQITSSSTGTRFAERAGMRTIGGLAVVVLLSGCWYERARPSAPKPAAVKPAALEPAAPPPPLPPSYRALTITLDAVGVAMMTAGVLGLRRGDDEDVSGALLNAGLLTSGFGVPVAHYVKGTNARALGSWLLRSSTVTAGALVGFGVGCADGRGMQMGCALEGMAWGVAGGLAIAGVIDAAFLHGWQPAGGFAPTLTPRDGGAQVGIATVF